MFSPPYDWAAVTAKQTLGNMALLAVVDSREPDALLEATQAVFPALIHLGMPYAIHDLATGSLAVEEMRGYRAVLLCQEGLSKALSQSEQRALVGVLEEGTGIISLDFQMPHAAPGLARALGLREASAGTSTALRIASDDHYVIHTYEPGAQVKLIRPVPLLAVALAGELRAPLLTGEGAPALVLGRKGGGHFVHWCLSPKMWLNDYLGHANGLDGAFWRGIVWAARKPFVMKAMPPFVTARLDDCQGVGSLWWSIQPCLRPEPPIVLERVRRLIHDLVPGRRSAAYAFQYIDVFNKHGVIPEVGIYPDQVSREDRARLKQYYDAGKAEFSIHAMSEFIDYDRRRVINLLYQKGWHQEADGSYVIDEHTPEDLAALFMRADQFWAETGIRPGRVVNSHYTNPGLNALPFLKERGQDVMMGGYLFGHFYDSHYKDVWSRAPYGTMGLILDYMPVPEGIPGVAFGDFFCAEAHYYDPYRWATEGRVDDEDIDFAGRVLRDWGRPEANVDAAAQALARQVRMGLDSLIFGCEFAHEQGLATLTVPELDEILTTAHRALGRYDMLFATYDHVAEYAKCKVDSHIERLDQLVNGLQCRLSGRTTLPLQLYEFADDGEGCQQVFDEVPAFSGGLTTMLVPGGKP